MYFPKLLTQNPLKSANHWITVKSGQVKVLKKVTISTTINDTTSIMITNK